MKTKNFFYFFSFAIVFIAAFTMKTFAQCPNISDLLDKGWAAVPGEHTPGQANHDEFAATDPQPFILKVNDYPPVKSFPMIPQSGNVTLKVYDKLGAEVVTLVNVFKNESQVRSKL